MAHNIFGSRFASHRTPAWHGLGTVFQEDMTAEAAFEMVGMYKVELEPIQTVSGLVLPNKAIVRHPTRTIQRPACSGSCPTSTP